MSIKLQTIFIRSVKMSEISLLKFDSKNLKLWLHVDKNPNYRLFVEIWIFAKISVFDKHIEWYSLCIIY